MSRNSQYAELIQTSTSKCCKISDGEITPQLMHEFSKRQRNWFTAKDIKKPDQAKRSFVAFSNNRKIDKYINNNEDRLAAMEFDAFEDWAKKVLTDLMSKKLRRGMSFATHSQDIVYLNRLLEGTPEQQSDTQLRSHVTAGLPTELHEHAFSIVADTYDKWSIELVRLIKKDADLSKRLALQNSTITATIQNSAPAYYQNENHHNNNGAYQQPSANVNYQQQQFLNALNAQYNQNNVYQRQQDNGYQNRSQNQFPSQPALNRLQGHRQLQQMDKGMPNYDWPPYLKPDERGIIVEFNGCLGCHRVDVPPGHRANNCDTPESLCPHGSDYQPVTRESAMRQLQAMQSKRPREPMSTVASPSAPATKRCRPIVSVVAGRNASTRAALELGGFLNQGVRTEQRSNAEREISRQPSFEVGSSSRQSFGREEQRRMLSFSRCRASSENRKRRGPYAPDLDSNDERRGHPNVSMPVATLYKDFEDERDSEEEEDELRENSNEDRDAS
ncbi:hypothetical protein C8J56DRAFT_900439, partial [Mycena floridula]